MARPALHLKEQFASAAPRWGAVRPCATPWSFPEVAGRLVEISGARASAALTATFAMVLEAQRVGETTAWVMIKERSFYPPDAAECGVDLDALVVVHVPDPASVPRAADRLVRSGAFGLVVLDAGEAEIPTPLQARLAALAKKHHAAVVCLTEKTAAQPSLGSLISLRAHAQRTRIAADQFLCELRALKDKRRGPTWTHREICRGPAGISIESIEGRRL